jgi:hypothetical protein
MITTSDGRQFLHSPEDAAQETYLAWIATAKNELYISDYSFNLIQYEAIIPQLLANGVCVGLVLDSSQAKGPTETPLIKFFKNLLTQYPQSFVMVLGESPDHRINHDKFTVKDKLQVEYGSYNYTSAAELENNFLVFDPDPQVAAWFRQLWKTEYAYMSANQKMGVELKSGGPMTNQQFVHYVEVFVSAFVAFLGSSGLNLFNLPGESNLKKLALSAIIAGVVAVYQQIVKPGTKALAAKL